MPSNSAIIFDVSGNTRPLEQDIAQAIRRIPAITIPVNVKGAPLGKIVGDVNEFNKSLEASNARLVAFGAGAVVLGTVAAGMRALVENAIKVNKALTDINAIVRLSDNQLGAFSDKLFAIAKNTGQSFDVVAQVAQNFARQTSNVSDVLKRTNDALILTRLTGLDTAKSLAALTTAVNTFGSEVGDTTTIINKLIAVDKGFAVNAKDLAEGLTRSASAAKDAKVNFDQLAALITTVQAITQRGGAVIGNAFKSIFTRLERSDTLDQLEKLGVGTRNLQGQTVGAVQILSELAKRYNTLSESQKAYASQLVGGVYNINILKAALGDLGNAQGIYAHALNASVNANDAAIARNELLSKSYSSLLNSAQVNFTKLTASIGNLTLGPAIKNIFGNTSALGEDIAGSIGADGIGTRIGKGILKGIGTYISGPGLVLAGTLAAKFFGKFISFSAQATKSVLNLGQANLAQRQVQEGINGLLQRQPEIYQRIIQSGATRLQQERAILALIEQQINAQSQASRLVGGLGTSLYSQNVRFNGQFSKQAEGFVPNFSPNISTVSNISSVGYSRETSYDQPKAYHHIKAKSFINQAQKNEAQGFIPNYLVAQEQNLARDYGYNPGAVIPYQTKGQDSGLSPSQFIEQSGIGKGKGFVPNFANSVVNTAEYKLTRAGSNSVGIIPPTDVSKIDMSKAHSKGFNLEKIAGNGFVPNFADSPYESYSSYLGNNYGGDTGIGLDVLGGLAVAGLAGHLLHAGLSNFQLGKGGGLKPVASTSRGFRSTALPSFGAGDILSPTKSFKGSFYKEPKTIDITPSSFLGLGQGSFYDAFKDHRPFGERYPKPSGDSYPDIDTGTYDHADAAKINRSFNNSSQLKAIRSNFPYLLGANKTRKTLKADLLGHAGAYGLDTNALSGFTKKEIANHINLHILGREGNEAAIEGLYKRGFSGPNTLGGTNDNFNILRKYGLKGKGFVPNFNPNVFNFAREVSPDIESRLKIIAKEHPKLFQFIASSMDLRSAKELRGFGEMINKKVIQITPSELDRTTMYLDVNKHPDELVDDINKKADQFKISRPFGNGFVPNFDALHDAMKRESGHGKLPVVGSAPELGVPVGVYNTEQRAKYGNLSNTIKADHLGRGQSSDTIGLSGSGKEKYLPNFADPIGFPKSSFDIARNENGSYSPINQVNTTKQDEIDFLNANLPPKYRKLTYKALPATIQKAKQAVIAYQNSQASSPSIPTTSASTPPPLPNSNSVIDNPNSYLRTSPHSALKLAGGIALGGLAASSPHALLASPLFGAIPGVAASTYLAAKALRGGVTGPNGILDSIANGAVSAKNTLTTPINFGPAAAFGKGVINSAGSTISAGFNGGSNFIGNLFSGSNSGSGSNANSGPNSAAKVAGELNNLSNAQKELQKQQNDLLKQQNDLIKNRSLSLEKAAKETVDSQNLVLSTSVNNLRTRESQQLRSSLVDLSPATLNSSKSLIDHLNAQISTKGTVTRANGKETALSQTEQSFLQALTKRTKTIEDLNVLEQNARRTAQALDKSQNDLIRVGNGISSLNNSRGGQRLSALNQSGFAGRAENLINGTQGENVLSGFFSGSLQSRLSTDALRTQGIKGEGLFGRYTKDQRDNALRHSNLSPALLDKAGEVDQNRATTRLQGLFGASFAAPILGGIIGNELNKNGQNPQGERIAQGIGGAAGTFAQFAAFGPQAAAVGAVVAGFQGLNAVISNLKPSFEDLDKVAEDYKSKQEEQIKSIDAYNQAQTNLNTIIAQNGTKAQLNIAKQQSVDALQAVPDDLRSKVINAKSSDDINQIQSELAQRSAQEYNSKKAEAELKGFNENRAGFANRGGLKGVYDVFSGQADSPLRSVLRTVTGEPTLNDSDKASLNTFAKDIVSGKGYKNGALTPALQSQTSSFSLAQQQFLKEALDKEVKALQDATVAQENVSEKTTDFSIKLAEVTNSFQKFSEELITSNNNLVKNNQIDNKFSSQRNTIIGNAFDDKDFNYRAQALNIQNTGATDIQETQAKGIEELLKSTNDLRNSLFTKQNGSANLALNDAFEKTVDAFKSSLGKNSFDTTSAGKAIQDNLEAFASKSNDADSNVINFKDKRKTDTQNILQGTNDTVSQQSQSTIDELRLLTQAKSLEDALKFGAGTFSSDRPFAGIEGAKSANIDLNFQSGLGQNTSQGQIFRGGQASRYADFLKGSGLDDVFKDGIGGLNGTGNGLAQTIAQGRVASITQTLRELSNNPKNEGASDAQNLLNDPTKIQQAAYFQTLKQLGSVPESALKLVQGKVAEQGKFDPIVQSLTTDIKPILEQIAKNTGSYTPSSNDSGSTGNDTNSGNSASPSTKSRDDYDVNNRAILPGYRNSINSSAISGGLLAGTRVDDVQNASVLKDRASSNILEGGQQSFAKFNEEIISGTASQETYRRTLVDLTRRLQRENDLLGDSNALSQLSQVDQEKLRQERDLTSIQKNQVQELRDSTRLQSDYNKALESAVDEFNQQAISAKQQSILGSIAGLKQAGAPNEAIQGQYGELAKLEAQQGNLGQGVRDLTSAKFGNFNTNDRSKDLEDISKNIDTLKEGLGDTLSKIATFQEKPSAGFTALGQGLSEQYFKQAFGNIFDSLGSLFAGKGSASQNLPSDKTINAQTVIVNGASVSTPSSGVGKGLLNNPIANNIANISSNNDSDGDLPQNSDLPNLQSDFRPSVGGGSVSDAPTDILSDPGAYSAQRFAIGGMVRGGSGTKDDVPAMMSGGEYVIKKSAVQKYGSKLLDSLNSGKTLRLAGGGTVGDINESYDSARASNFAQTNEASPYVKNQHYLSNLNDLNSFNEQLFNQAVKDQNTSQLIGVLGTAFNGLSGAAKQSGGFGNLFSSLGNIGANASSAQYSIGSSSDYPNSPIPALASMGGLINGYADGGQVGDSEGNSYLQKLGQIGGQLGFAGILDFLGNLDWRKKQQLQGLKDYYQRIGVTPSKGFYGDGRSLYLDGTNSLGQKTAGIPNDAQTIGYERAGEGYLQKLGSLFGFAAGGSVNVGSGTKDDVPALLMGGEYVLNKDTTRRIGVDALNNINAGRYASGGLVTPTSQADSQQAANSTGIKNSTAGNSSTSNNVGITLNITHNNNSTTSTTAVTNSNSSDSAKKNAQDYADLSKKVQSLVLETIKRQSATRGYLSR